MSEVLAKMNPFKVNDYIELKLENGKTNVYVDGERFIQCKQLLLNIYPRKEGEEFDRIEPIDETEIKREHSLSPEEEFKGHCSNLQVWVENDYDTNLLHINLSFPLLKRLTEVGDQQARRVFKNEIYKRFAEGEEATIVSLIESDYLNRDENEFLLEDPKITQNFLTIMQNGHYRNPVLNFIKFQGKKGLDFIICKFPEVVDNFNTWELSTLLNYLKKNLSFQKFNAFLEKHFLSFLINKYKKLSCTADLHTVCDGLNMLLSVIGVHSFLILNLRGGVLITDYLII